jgi:hypothetical protein
MSTLADIRQKVVGLVRDDAGKLANPDDYDRNIGAALARYSRHKPALKVVDVNGNGTHDYDLPLDWVDEFSNIRSIEYPVGDVPAALLENDEHEVYQAPTAKKIRLMNESPSAAESFRVTFTILRTASTVPAGDVDAFSWLAAALCCEELANAYAQSGDSTIVADSVDYKDKSYRFASRAKRLQQLYKEHMGLKEDDSAPAASAVADLDIGYPGGGGRLTHPRRQRERR